MYLLPMEENLLWAEGCCSNLITIIIHHRNIFMEAVDQEEDYTRTLTLPWRLRIFEGLAQLRLTNTIRN